MDRPSRHPCKYLIPDGYVGKVRIYFSLPDAKPLPLDGGMYVVVIPPDGRLRTSTGLETGSAKDEYYYYSNNSSRQIPATGWGAGGMIWGGNVSVDKDPVTNREVDYLGFFVGTEAQYQAAFQRSDRD
ncbi:MAG TPA: hypothetical protein VFC63_21760 [Blastocatellia bacterium]|nr:hypothetical protein [Blastocatellia bacterium]